MKLLWLLFWTYLVVIFNFFFNNFSGNCDSFEILFTTFLRFFSALSLKLSLASFNDTFGNYFESFLVIILEKIDNSIRKWQDTSFRNSFAICLGTSYNNSFGNHWVIWLFFIWKYFWTFFDYSSSLPEIILGIHPEIIKLGCLRKFICEFLLKRVKSVAISSWFLSTFSLVIP